MVSINTFNNDHQGPSHCYFSDLYDDASRGAQYSERGPSETEFQTKMVGLLDLDQDADTITQAIYNEFIIHLGCDDYHYALNEIFQSVSWNEKTKKIYSDLWKRLSELAANSIFTVTLGSTENARMNPLLPELSPCEL